MTTGHEVDARPRVLIPITIHFAVRYIVRTGLVARLRDVCVPVVGLSWDDPDLSAELAEAGIEVVRLPPGEMSVAVAAASRGLAVAFARRLASPSTAIDRTRRDVDEPTLVRWRRWASSQRDALYDRFGAETRARARLQDLLPTDTNAGTGEAFLEAHRIDALFSVTPFAAQEMTVLFAARRLGLLCCTSILSFDNITTRPPLPILFDRYLVWNRANRDEIRRGYPSIDAGQVAIVGPAQFDFHRDPSYVLDERLWRERVGLCEGDRTILYGAGPPSVSSHEGQYVDHLCDAIEGGELPSDLRIVLRRHPNDHPGRWERFHDHPLVVFDDPGRIADEVLRPGHVNMERSQIVALCSALAHTDVHVSVSSTMTLDGAFYDKPQLGPAYDDTGGRRHRRRAANLYAREHFVPIVASNGIELSFDRRQLVEQVRSALSWPTRLAAERQAMLETVCTFTDGAATDRVAEQIRHFLVHGADDRPRSTTRRA